MNYVAEIVSAVTAFVITAGGTIVVVVGSQPAGALNRTAWTLASILGLVASAKDLRSSFRLPPIGATPGDGSAVPTPSR